MLPVTCLVSADPGILAPLPNLEPLGPVSPSHVIGLQACALREVWAANRIRPLLPTSPAARLGTVAHSLLEEAGRGRFTQTRPGAIERRWDALLDAAEDTATRSWLDRHLVPFATAIPDFEVRRLQAITTARSLTAEASAVENTPLSPHQPPIGCEMAVVTPDERAAGRIDVVCASDDGPILKDYKSGAIYDRANSRRAVKPEYAVQLKLYAAIYAAMTGTWPSRLEVVPISGPPEPVSFTREECEYLLDEAVQLRDRINTLISAGGTLASQIDRLATPSPPVCRYCAYRPQCPPYVKARARDRGAVWPLDVRGHLVEQRKLGNGRLLLVLDSEGTTVHIRGVDPSAERHPALTRMTVGDPLAGFNLRPEGNRASFVEGSFTVFYRVLSPEESDASDSETGAV